MNNLYVYVNGSDLEQICDVLEEEFKNFLSIWVISRSRFINHKFERTPDLLPEDHPDWNLGINVTFDKLPFEKIEQLIQFLNTLSCKTNREFVIGYYDEEHDISEDWCFIGKEYSDKSVAFLKKLYGS